MLNSIIAAQVPAIYVFIYAAIAVSDCDECGFNDLGKLLFGGLALAVIVGVAASLWFRRMKDKTASDSEFVSIRSSSRDE